MSVWWWGVGGLASVLALAGPPPDRRMGEERHLAVTAATGATPRPAAAGSVVGATFWSQSLGVRKRVLAWLPPSYDTAPARRYPVAIYLHGYGGSERDWTASGGIDSALTSLAAAGQELIVVMPDGDDGWYTTWNVLGDYGACRRDFAPREGDTADTWCVPWPHYDDYIAHDLVQFIDRTWRTVPGREHRAIAGLSMGGYGALSLALAYPETFAVAASHSGVVSPLFAGPTPFQAPPRYASRVSELEEGWGPRFWPLLSQVFGRDLDAWWSRDPLRRVQRLRRLGKPLPALYVDIGTEDGLVNQNRALHHELQAMGVPHDYREFAGVHDWAYWRAHVGQSLRFIAARVGDGTPPR